MLRWVKNSKFGKGIKFLHPIQTAIFSFRADLCNHCVEVGGSRSRFPLFPLFTAKLPESSISSNLKSLDDNQLNSPKSSQAIDLTPVGLSGAIPHRSTSPPPVLKPRALSRELPPPSAGPVLSKDWYKIYVVRREIFPDSVARQLSDELEMAT